MSNTVPTSGVILGSSTYNKLKWLAIVGFPAFGAAYFGLSDLWSLPKATEVLGTLNIVGVLLGSLLGFSTRNYNKAENAEPEAGILAITGYNEDTGNPDLEFTVTKDPVDLANKSKITFQVDKKVHIPPRDYTDSFPEED